jgi:hypothetical protein
MHRLQTQHVSHFHKHCPQNIIGLFGKTNKNNYKYVRSTIMRVNFGRNKQTNKKINTITTRFESWVHGVDERVLDGGRVCTCR